MPTTEASGAPDPRAPRPSPASPFRCGHEDGWHGRNPFDPSFRADPYPHLAHLREFDPVNLTPVGLWRLTRFADVERILKDVPTGVRTSSGDLPGRVGEVEARPAEFMLSQDPPNHTRLRKLVSKAFTPRAVERLRERIQAIADEQIARVLARGEMDVIADLALPVPATMICEMMGVPLADRDRFTVWTADATHVLAAPFAPPDLIERGVAAGDALRGYFESLIEARRRNLGEDILSDLIRAEEDGDQLTPSELVSQSIGLLIAGFETTIGLIGNGVLALIRHPDQLALLRERPELLPNAIDECLRYDGPILLTVRVLREDTAFGDTTIPKDAMVFAMLAGANRDPARYRDPDRFDVARDDHSPLGFGGGIHYCLGAHLARMEAQVAIGTLVRSVRDLALATDDLAWGRSLFRVLDRLPVTFRPA
ncbi:MAG TPA: cytochrome P450 [Candidatus Binatia bacterium]|nr:cytochrome P450 [Candidatus Binatia bacterium]